MLLLTVLVALIAAVLAVISLVARSRSRKARAVILGAVATFIALLGAIFLASAGRGWLYPIILAVILIFSIVSVILAVTISSPQVSGAAVATGGTSRTNGIALASVIVVWFSAIIGLILGHVALNQINQSGDQGRGMAKTAVVAGWIQVGLSIIAGLVVGFYYIAALNH